MTTYFLSYARADQTQALRFANDLITAGVSVWVDQYDIRPSQHWDRAVETAVRSCEGMIVILSPRSVASPNVADEISVGIDDKKAMIPILIEPCTLPLRMTRMQFIDATHDYQGALRRCLAAIVGKRDVAHGSPEGAQQPAAAEPAALPQDVLDEAQRRLTGLMGPIAKVLLKNAHKAASKSELYNELARSIGNAADRESFLGWLKEPTKPGQVVTPRSPPAATAGTPASAEPAATVNDEAVAAVTRALIHHLGPIAAALVKRERPQAASLDDLARRLAQRIPGEKDRAAFLKDIGVR